MRAGKTFRIPPQINSKSSRSTPAPLEPINQFLDRAQPDQVAKKLPKSWLLAPVYPGVPHMENF